MVSTGIATMVMVMVMVIAMTSAGTVLIWNKNLAWNKSNV